MVVHILLEYSSTVSLLPIEGPYDDLGKVEAKELWMALLKGQIRP